MYPKVKEKKYRVEGLSTNLTLWARNKDEVHRKLEDLNFKYFKKDVTVTQVYDLQKD